MFEATEKALTFVANRNREELESDELLAFALARALEILGEAASKIAGETRQDLSSIPWGVITGMRNRLAHAYNDINLNVLWKTATEDLPTLLPLLRAALARDAPPR